MKKVICFLLVSFNALAGEIVNDKVKLIDLNQPDVKYTLSVRQDIPIQEAYKLKNNRYMTMHVTTKGQCYVFWSKQPAIAGHPYVLAAGDYVLARIRKDSTPDAVAFIVPNTDIREIQCVRLSGSLPLFSEDMKTAFRSKAEILEEPCVQPEPVQTAEAAE